MEEKLKHLELIQEVINRMSKNSFSLKGWSVALVSALFALATKDSNKKFIVLAYFPVVMFWISDAYYLSQERYMRFVYDEVRKKSEKLIDFSMKSDSSKWNLYLWLEAFVSPTISIFYGLIVVLLIFVFFII